MDLKHAKEITKTFTQDGNTKTPTLSDDWIYSFQTYHNSDDKVIISSKSKDIQVAINISIQSFFRNFIYTKKIKIDGNKFVGSFSFTKYNLYMEEEFLNAQDLVSLSELNDPIPNNELIEFGLYIDDKGSSFVYLGNMSFNFLDIREEYADKEIKINLNETKDRKRYIVKYDNDNIKYDSIIQKNSKRKFIELSKILIGEERKEFMSKLISSKFSQLFIRENGNDLNIIRQGSVKSSSSLVYYNDIFGYYHKSYKYGEGYEYSFRALDYELFTSDIKTNSLHKELNNYLVEKIEFIEEKEVENMEQVYIYLDYI